ncbi:5-dehydro-4-deoxy-D-glucuronate isomerase [Acetonema longum]|uniref:4-deoxy-L-threo-5-hexosulose-uronate ketol-isomerase n=1 Tax=Acetonema longum DSM 6540 TaxID=1009370 RepID=F7NKI5_9FIRM|nr:5-dehydro-4-deoxy-D-glucuronate isomerase [Acetonema longum]EGO63437.1 5-keto-4-deoxyuronate isomerase [Acetonema longum DSM 6540]
MEIRTAVSPRDIKAYTTERMREEFLIQDLLLPGKIKMVYSHVDRIIAGGARPAEPIALQAGKEIGADFFLQRREMGIVNIGPAGTVMVDGTEYRLEKSDGLYVSMGSKDLVFSSDDPKNPAKFYFNSCPAHAAFPTKKILKKDIKGNHLGSIQQSNERTIYKYIDPQAGAKSCQLVMGMTVLEPGNMWNSMPCHTHDRRMEVYFYFDLPENAVVFHLMGEPAETRHIVMRNEEAVISPSWSIHSGVGTASYTFIWGMCGENQNFDDMDHVPMAILK